MTGSGKGASTTASSSAPGKAKPARARAAKSTSSGKAGASRKTRTPRKSAGKAASGRARASSAASAGKPPRLSAGGLDPLVLDYLRKNKVTAPHTPGQVAKALGRSSGAVGNCLTRLTNTKKAKRVSAKPQQFDLAG
jgi:hypothetical protein